MGKITTEDVQKIALLSRLELKNDDSSRFAGQLENILTYIDTLSEVDVSAVEPFAPEAIGEKILRPDAIGETLPRAEALQNAPQADDCFFQVPAVVK